MRNRDPKTAAVRQQCKMSYFAVRIKIELGEKDSNYGFAGCVQSCISAKGVHNIARLLLQGL